MSAWGGVEPVSPPRHFAKVGVEGSNPFARSSFYLFIIILCVLVLVEHLAYDETVDHAVTVQAPKAVG